MSKDKIINLAKKLISIKTVSSEKDNMQAIIDLCAEELKGSHIKIFEDESYPSILASNKNGETNFKYIFNAHLDVVPAKPEQFKPIVENNKLIGRGALDMKAAAAVELLVFNEVYSEVDYPLGLQLVTDEEIGGAKGTKLQIEKNITADFVIAGEPTSLEISNKSKGILRLEITLQGKNAHSALPWNGSNVVWRLNKFLNDLKNFYPELKIPGWETSFNLANIKMNNLALNQIPDTLIIQTDIRYVEDNPSEIRLKVENLLQDDEVVEIIMIEPLQFTEEKNMHILNLQNVMFNQSLKSNISYSHFATDLRHYTSKNMPGVAFGPSGEGMHEDFEWVDINSLYSYYDVLKNYLNLQ